MSNLWFDYYLIRFGILALILVCSAAVVVFLVVRRRWQHKHKSLELELADCQATHFQKLYSYFQRIVAHEYGKGLNYILNKSIETREGLGKDQTALRDKQDGIIAKTHELQQHAMNILSVFALEPDKLKKELLNIRQLIESVLLELFPYAESQGVILRPNLADIEPIFLDRDLTKLSVRNLIHNAIKYSYGGGVVEIILTVEEDETSQEKGAIITVKDSGRGIKDQDKDSLFELNMRGDGLIETGSGLGLYCARKAARLQGGDVVLESSSPNQGSVFRTNLPYATAGEVAKETEVEEPRRSRTAWIWGMSIVGILGAVVFLFFLFKPPGNPKPTPVETITPAAPLTPTEEPLTIITLVSFHGSFVTAMGEDSGWVVKQEPGLGDCGKFTLVNLGEKVALRTCYDRYVTAPRLPNENLVTTEHDKRWELWQESSLGDCGMFEMLELADGKVAFRTCAGMVFTAGDGGWEPPEMKWSVVAETNEIKDWEKFTLEQQR